VRNWLELLVVPLVLLGIGLLFQLQQSVVEERRLEAQSVVEERRLEAARHIEEQRAQDEALQTYLGQMGQMLLDEDRSLRQSKEGDEVRLLARARTVTILRRLNSDRNRVILQFLREARLVPPDGDVFTLEKSNLSEANLKGADLDSFSLYRTDLSGANLRDAYLAWSYLRRAKLNGANLRGADLHGDPDEQGNTDLSLADLSGANLRSADLHGGPNLSNTNLSEANLKGANLKGANLKGANLKGAVLSGAKVTDEHLAEAKSLEGATMPDGQSLKSDDNPDGPTLKEWLKSKRREEDGKNASQS
jgi:uncharacterized protein YjbI with pentapeptide repeats